MPKPVRIVLACFALVTAVLAGSSPSLAERSISGAEAQRILTGKQFQIQCVDGTAGYGHFGAGVVTVAYRRFNAPSHAPDMRDRATVRTRGHEICLAWKEFDGGGGCYPAADEDAGHFRIRSSMRWCEIKAKLH